jgi:hypothetical protein
MTRLCQFFAALTLLTGVAAARTLNVGPGRSYAAPCAAISQAVSGDIIEIDAAVYSGDVCAIVQNNLTLRGVGGRPRLEAGGKSAGGKGIWVVVGDNIVVENIEFTGATVEDGNGAGIRLDSGNLTVRNCYFHHNENGILGGSRGELLVEYSEFAFNGKGDGYTHNMYIGGGITKFTLRFSYSHNAVIGHLVKSRAQSNYILYNRLTEEGGTGSYELDLPNGGLAFVIGNSFQQDNATDNENMVSYGVEGLSPVGAVHQLYAVNNTLVNQGPANTTYFLIAAGSPAVLRNNLFSGSGLITSQTAALKSNNIEASEAGLANAAGYDFRLTAFSPALNAGADPGTAVNGFSLRPQFEYRHPLCSITRADVGPIDAGAFEYGNPDPGSNCSGTPPPEAFADVSPTDPFLPAINLMRDKGITNGCGVNPARYCPADNVTRGQMAVFLVRSAMRGDSFTSNPTPYFQDVPASHPFFRWIQKLWELGITTGCGTGLYCPEAEVTRGQMAAFIIRARFGPSEEYRPPTAALFTDVPENYPFFLPIQKMKQIGITSGCSITQYCPSSPITRGQMAVFVMRGLFNLLLPDTTPILTLMTPSSGTVGAEFDVYFTGLHTNFSPLTTLVAGPGVTISQVSASNATTLSAHIRIAPNATPGPRSFTALTNGEDATLPNGLMVQ